MKVELDISNPVRKKPEQSTRPCTCKPPRESSGQKTTKDDTNRPRQDPKETQKLVEASSVKLTREGNENSTQSKNRKLQPMNLVEEPPVTRRRLNACRKHSSSLRRCRSSCDTLENLGRTQTVTSRKEACIERQKRRGWIKCKEEKKRKLTHLSGTRGNTHRRKKLQEDESA